MKLSTDSATSCKTSTLDTSSRYQSWAGRIVSHHRAPFRLLPTLSQIPLLLLPPRNHMLTRWHPLNPNPLLPVLMPPPQLLNQTIALIAADTPLPTTNLHHTAILRKMKLGQENLRWKVLRRSFIPFKTQVKDGVLEIKARSKDVADGGDGRGADVGFCGAVAGRVG